MADKWTEKDVLDHAKELRSPFENTQNGQGKLAGMAEKVSQMFSKKKGEVPK